MKSDWKECTLAELGEIVGGATPSTKDEQNYGGDIAWITPKDLSTLKGRFISRGERNITEKGLRSCSAQIMPKNAVLFSSRAPIGYVAIAANPVCTNQGFKSIVSNSANDPMFLYYLLKYNKNAIEAMGRGTTFKEVSGSTMRGIRVYVPISKAEQQRIAAILSALDEKIAINREINDNLQQQAASIFAEWLNTCTDFSTIGDMAHNILDYSPVGSEQIRLLNSSDVTEGVFPIAPLVPNKDLKGHFKKRFKFGDILYSEIRPRNHHYGFVLFDASDYIASTRLMVIRAIENKVSPAMLYQYLLLPEVEAEFTLKTESRSGTFPQGNYADMASIQVPYSPTNSQTAVSEILSRIRFAIAQNQFESQRLAELRDTLLPKLMSGEIDVSAVQP